MSDMHGVKKVERKGCVSIPLLDGGSIASIRDLCLICRNKMSYREQMILTLRGGEGQKDPRRQA